MTPQQRSDAERAILGAILTDDVKNVVLIFLRNKKKLTAAHFCSHKNVTIWKTICKIADDGYVPTVYSVRDYLELSNELENVGGFYYIESLIIDAMPFIKHAERHADNILLAVTLGKIQQLSAALAETAKAGDLPECIALQEKIRNTLDSHAADSVDEQFPPIRLNDLVAYTVPEGHIIAGHGWLRRGAGCLLTGGTSIGKSVLAEQIAVSVAAGTPILNCIGVPSPFRVTYIQAENDEETLKRDITSIVGHLGPTRADPAVIQENLAIHHVYGMSGPTFDAWVESQIVRQKTDLLIIDPYQNFIPAGSNINDAGTFLAFSFGLNRIIKQHNCAFLLITHTPKPQDREHWTARESVYMAVGSQAIAAWARTSAELTGFKDDDSKYRLRFGKNAERNGIAMPGGGGGLVRDLYIEHSGTIHEPYWRVSELQQEPTVSNEKAAKIIKLATEHPELTFREVASQTGCSLGMVSKYHPGKKRRAQDGD